MWHWHRCQYCIGTAVAVIWSKETIGRHTTLIQVAGKYNMVFNIELFIIGMLEAWYVVSNMP
jgi:hypothetical protein